MKKIHIVFGESTKQSLLFALRSVGRHKEEVISVPNDFSIGRLEDFHVDMNLEEHLTWMRTIFGEASSRDFQNYLEEMRQFHMNLNNLSEGTLLAVWSAENACEQTGMYYLIYLLEGSSQRIQVIQTSEIYHACFNHPDVTFEIRGTGEIIPEKLETIIEMKSEAPLLTEEERAYFIKEWDRLSKDNACLRVWQGGQVVSVAENYFDDFILETARKLSRERLTEEWIPATRLIGDVIGHLRQAITDAFLSYRLRELIAKGHFAYKGELTSIRLYQIRLKS